MRETRKKKKKNISSTFFFFEEVGGGRERRWPNMERGRRGVKSQSPQNRNIKGTSLLLCDTAVCFLNAHETGTNGWSPKYKASHLMLTLSLSQLQQSRRLGRFRLSPFVYGPQLLSWDGTWGWTIPLHTCCSAELLSRWDSISVSKKTNSSGVFIAWNCLLNRVLETFSR